MRKLMLIWLALLVALPLWGATSDLAVESWGTSLSAVSATGAGNDFYLKTVGHGGGLRKTWAALSWQTSFSGSPTSITVNLEGSNDGSTWVTLDTSTATAGESRSVAGKYYERVRCNIAAYVVNGSTATCKVKGLDYSNDPNPVFDQVEANAVAVSTTVQSPEFCIGSDCITVWPSGGGSGVPATSATDGQFLTGFAGSAFTKAQADFNKLLNKPTLGTAAAAATTDFAPVSHTQAISTITDLETTLDGKAASNASTTVNSQTCALGGSCTVTADPTSAKYKSLSCAVGIGDGLNAIPTGDYVLDGQCLNNKATVTISSIKCFADAGSSTAAVKDNSTNDLATTFTATSSWATGSPTATTTIALGAWTKWTLHADGTSKQIECVLTGSY